MMEFGYQTKGRPSPEVPSAKRHPVGGRPHEWWLVTGAGFGVLLTGCGAQQEVASHVPEWVGPFTVREISLPASLVVRAFPRYGPYALAGTGRSCLSRLDRREAPSRRILRPGSSTTPPILRS